MSVLNFFMIMKFFLKNCITPFFLIFLFVKCSNNDLSKQKTNILFILTDDQRANTINYLGNDEIVTPNIDFLAKNGISFLNTTIMGANNGAWMVGPRLGKYVDGKSNVIPGHNLLLGTLGVFILWLGWFGFNGGSQLAWGGDDSIAASAVVMVTNIAAAGGAVGAMATTWLKDGKPNLGMTLNGVIAGLVAITAGCGNMTFGGGFLAGLVGGIIVVFSIEFIDKVLKIDDAVGAASAHGVAGAWGTLVIGLWGVDGDTGIGLLNGGGASQLGIQAIGVLAYGVWATVTALIGFGVLKATLGLRVSEEVEKNGLDEAEHGIGGFEGGGFEAWAKDNMK